jgi:hypothetical protein
MPALLLLLIVVALDLLAIRFGADSRDGAAWSLPGQDPAAGR